MYTTRNFSIIFVTLLLMSLGRYVVADGDSNLSPVYQPAPTYSSPNGLQPSALFKVIPSSAPVKSDKDSAQADQPIYNPDTYVAPSAQPISGNQNTVSANLGTEHGGYNSVGNNYAGQYQGYSPYEPGYGVQSGYEGYLVPSHYNQLSVIDDEVGPLSYVWGLLPPATAVLGFLGTSGLFLLKGLGVLLLGSIAVLGVCTFTPFCTLYINGLGAGLLKEEVRGLVTPDRLSAAAKFVRDAIDKYQELNNIEKKN